MPTSPAASEVSTTEGGVTFGSGSRVGTHGWCRSMGSSSRVLEFLGLSARLEPVAGPRRRELVCFAAAAVVLVAAGCRSASAGAGGVPLPGVATPVLPHAHSHNDYERERPLHDALELGYCSIEADVYLIDGEIIVKHLPWERSRGTLTSLYLDPLRERVQAHGGSVYGDRREVVLLVDIKSNAKAMLRALNAVLPNYADMLTEVVDGEERRRAVRIVLSGNRPVEAVRRMRRRFVGIDGRLGEGNALDPVHLRPWVSARWPLGDVRGRALTDAEVARIRAIVRAVHREGRTLRFWGLQENEQVWRQLLDVGVDHIGADNLTQLAVFLRR